MVRGKLRAGFFYSALVSSLAYACLYINGAKDYDVKCVQNNKGYCNRNVDGEFVQEFADGINALSAAYKKDGIVGGRTGNIVSLDVFVSDTVKFFFDDAKNPSDNYAWVHQTVDCLDGLKKFSEFGGIEFKVNKFVGVFEKFFVGKQETSSEFVDALQARVRLEQVSPVVVYLRAGDLKLKTDGPLASRVIGHSDYPSSLTLVNLNNSKYVNQLVMAHEMAHIFGASHTTNRTVAFMKIRCFSAPFLGYVGSGDIMEPIVNDLSPQSFWAQETIEEVRANKYRFIGRK